MLIEEIPQDGDGNWLVDEPVSDSRPDEIRLSGDGTTVEFSGLVGVHQRSRIRPDVLAYEECDVL